MSNMISVDLSNRLGTSTSDVWSETKYHHLRNKTASKLRQSHASVQKIKEAIVGWTQLQQEDVSKYKVKRAALEKKRLYRILVHDNLSYSIKQPPKDIKPQIMTPELCSEFLFLITQLSDSLKGILLDFRAADSR